MKGKNKKPFVQKTLRMARDHVWQAPPGYKIVVLDRGVVSFNVPDSWIVVNTAPFELNDAAPPDDDARITVSFWRLPIEIDWSGLPLGPLLTETMQNTAHTPLERSAIFDARRDGLEMVWMYHRFIDTNEPREAYTRVLMARGMGVQVLISSDFWASDLPRLAPIWDEVMRSLTLGRVIEDPTTGRAAPRPS
jgi:hypothetical protein